LVIFTELLDAELEIETSEDKYHEYTSGAKAKLFNGIEKIITKQNKVANIENM
jgi:hypothetical protein